MTAAPHLVTSYPNVSSEEISIALIGPDDDRRTAVLQVLDECKGADVQEYDEYPEPLHELPRVLDDKPAVVIIDLDSDPEVAVDLVERICGNGESTVMVYSTQTNTDQLVRCMRAGAREFLNVPLKPGALEEALVRASVRQPKAVTRTVRAGRLMVFMGAKGGVGVTSIACNFAVALAQERGQKTLFIDFDLPLGDAALNLGIVSEFSTVSALQAVDRLDGAFLSKLLTKHKSGLHILGAPGHFPNFEPSAKAIERLLTVARTEFDNVVVDAGSRLDLSGTVLHRDASKIYLVTQAGIPELRNANRLISQVFTDDTPQVELVLNRFQSRKIGLSEKSINEALTRPVRWKIPNDHALVCKMQTDASPLVLTDNPLAKIIREMAKTANGNYMEQEPEPKRKKRLGLF